MTNEYIREIAKEFRFLEIKPESDAGFISFARHHAMGQIRMNFYERSQLILLIITKNDKKGYRNFRKAFPTHEHGLVYEIFHKPNSFRKKYH